MKEMELQRTKSQNAAPSSNQALLQHLIVFVQIALVFMCKQFPVSTKPTEEICDFIYIQYFFSFPY